MSVDEVRALLGISELSEDIDVSKAGEVREKDRERVRWFYTTQV